MSKTKLAFLVFALAFGVNIAAFVFSHKAFVIEELKNVWIYELPATASPLDAYSAKELSPQQGIIGTLYEPEFESVPGTEQSKLTPYLADEGTWDEKSHQFTVKLKDHLTYSDGSPILASHFVDTYQWIKIKMHPLTWVGEWQAWIESTLTSPDPKTLVYTFQNFSTRSLLSNPLTGVIHPSNLIALQKGEKITKEWISSGSYKVRKWNPKRNYLDFKR